MKRRDIILAFILVIIWGANFTVIKLGLYGIPSMLLAAMRYIFAAFPAVFFVKKPSIQWKYIIAYGLTVGVGQFSCLFYAMDIGMPAGISSIVTQSQAFMTPLFAAMLLKEPIKGSQITGLAVSAIGLCLIGGIIGDRGLSTVPFGAFLVTLLAAFFWAISNIVLRYANKEAEAQDKTLDMFGMVVWSSLIPPIPLLGMALLLDSPETLISSLSNISIVSVFSILYLAFCATLFGYGVWSSLMGKYPAAKVAPLSLLVPITGLIVSWVVLDERLTSMQWVGGIVIIIGLLINNFGFTPIKTVFKAKEK
ncbi:EamA family transporter [Lutispora thermophila]|uniref:O-acetylserine/cysteine efflux transporter n=1 Tax=Lutispora thermophila DSM 19022 TaxID=1122184 RepID=A0A1M6BE77_9FIRM|nr:EamA family transporter [Lutispora thermophila]SHI47019.1 O-acetylserine/cysteine efflux transporter [Lutispora thermophila DSM 19022]